MVLERRAVGMIICCGDQVLVGKKDPDSGKELADHIERFLLAQTREISPPL